MKTYKTAKAILRHSLAEIEAGFWCKNDLYRITDEGYDDQTNRYTCTLRDRQIGCALGHIATFGGHTRLASIHVTKPDGSGEIVRAQVPNYPAEGTASDGLLKARDALAAAIPAATRKKIAASMDSVVVGGGNGRDLDYLVADYNDSDKMGQKKAAAWFRRALELV